MTLHTFDNLIKISRLKASSGNVRSYVATATAEASIQPLGKGREQFDSGLFGKTYVCYAPLEANVHKADQIKDKDGNIYVVQEAVERDFGAFPYLELILKRSS